MVVLFITVVIVDLNIDRYTTEPILYNCDVLIYPAPYNLKVKNNNSYIHDNSDFPTSTFIYLIFPSGTEVLSTLRN